MRPLLSDPRLRRYLDHYQGREVEALRLYTWNARLSAAFWGPLSVLEVVVRNAIHKQMVERCCKREDWWNDEHLYLCDRERQSVQSALDTLARRRKAAPSPDDVVAATSFGLWVGLVGAGRPRNQRYSYETTLWQPRLRKAFPYLGTARRRRLHDELSRLRALRNRIAHHEPIFLAPHEQLRRMILSVVGYVHPDAAAYVASHERITDVLNAKRACIKFGAAGF